MVWWGAVLLSFLWFDISWCSFTSFRPFKAYLSIYIVLPAAATLFSLPAVLSRRWWIQGVVVLLLDLLFVANLMYARTYMVPIPLESYAIAGNLSGFGASVIDSLRWSDAMFLIVATAAAVLASRLAPRCQQMSGRQLLTYSSVLLGLLALSYVTIAGRGGFKERFASMARSVNDQQSAAPVYTLFCTLLYDWMTLNEPLTQQMRDEVADWLESHNERTGVYVPQALPDSLGKRNVVLLLCESLESWPIGLTLEGKEITPFLNTLVADSTVYYCPKVLTQARDGRSIDAQLMYLAGQLPLSSGVYSMKYASSGYQTIPLAMKERGASTYLLSADRPTTWNQGPIAAAMGLDSLYMASAWSEVVTDGYYIPDGELFDKSISLMKDGVIWPEGEQAFLMWVTHTGHNPFKLPDGLDQLNLSGDYPELLGDFLATARYVDSSLEKIVDYIMSRDDSDDTAIVIVGDHEGLAVNRREFSERYPWVDSRQFTPLIILNSPYHGRDDKVIGQVDVYSALLDISGLYGVYPWRGMGFSPFDSAHPGGAVGSTGTMLSGDVEIDSLTECHLRDAYPVADRMLRYSLK